MARTLIGEIKNDPNPVGTTIDSILTEAQFQNEFSSDWVLADGRSVAGSQYETVTGNATIPDFRGQFKRGKNNGRSDGNENPDGDVALGTFQDMEIQSHRHRVFASTGAQSGSTQAENTSNSTAASYFTQNTGGNETRPKNITVNIFIKIN